MKKLITLVSIAALSFSLVGCGALGTLNNNTPHTSFSATIGGQTVAFQNPKDTVIDGLAITVGTNGVATVVIAHLTTIENPTNILDTGSAQAALIQANGQAIVNAINAASTAAGSAAGAVIK